MPDFNYHQIGTSRRYGCLLACYPANSAAFVVGDLYRTDLDTNYYFKIDAGRLGTPALELTIERKGVGHAPTRDATIAYEPGVAESGGTKYQLQSFVTAWLGKPGGGGHAYDYDPQAIKEASLDVKKRTLRVTITTNSHLALDPNAVHALNVALPAGSNSRQLLARMTSWTEEFRAKIYCVVPAASVDFLKARVLAPFESAFTLRLTPFHQYTSLQGISLNLPSLPTFRTHMYCNIDANGQYGPATLQVRDTRSYRITRPMAMMNCVGVVREDQAVESFCIDLGTCFQSARFVRPSIKGLAFATRAFGTNSDRGVVPEPLDLRLCLVYMGRVRTKGVHQISSPPPFYMFELECFRQTANESLASTGEKAYGMVLDVGARVLQKNDASFVMALWISDANFKARLAPYASRANVEPVLLRYIQNQKVPQTRLNAVKEFDTLSSIPSVLALQGKVLYHPFPLPSTSRDLRHGPTPPRNNPVELNRLTALYNNAVTDLRNLSCMTNMSPAELQLLTQVPGQIQDYAEAIRISVASDRFRAVCALVIALSAVSNQDDSKYETIVCVVPPGDRSKICYELYRMCRAAVAHSGACSGIWRKKNLLAYTATDVELAALPAGSTSDSNNLSDISNPLRERLDLTFKYLASDAPQHSFLLDEDGAYFNAPLNAPPKDHAPLDVSMGDAKQKYFASMQNVAERNQYFADRKNVLDGVNLTPDEVRQVQSRLRSIDRKVLQNTDFLITDYPTAMCEVVKSAFSRPILVLVGIERLTFAEAAGVLLAFKNYSAVFMLGDPDDTRHPPVFASLGGNEVWRTFGRSLFVTWANAGTRIFNLS